MTTTTWREKDPLSVRSSSWPSWRLAITEQRSSPQDGGWERERGYVTCGDRDVVLVLCPGQIGN